MKTISAILCCWLWCSVCFAGSHAVQISRGPAATGNLDAFSGSQTALATHNEAWTASADGVTNLEIDGSGSVRLTGNYRSGSAYYNGSTSDISELTADAGVTDGYFQPRACVRMSGSTRGYCFALVDVAAGEWSDIAVFKNTSVLCYLAGTYSTSTEHVIKIKASGTSTVTLNAYVDGSEVTSGCTDSTTPIESGAPGFMFSGGSAGGYTLNKATSWRDYE